MFTVLTKSAMMETSKRTMAVLLNVQLTRAGLVGEAPEVTQTLAKRFAEMGSITGHKSAMTEI